MSSLPLLRPLTVGEILDRAFRLYRTHFVLLISIPLLALVPMTFLQVVSQLLWHTTQWIDLLQNGFVQLLVSSALVVAISQAYLTRPPTLGEAYRAASQRYGAAWRGNFLMGLAIALPAAALACGTIMLAQDQGIWIVIVLILPFAMFLGTRWSLMLPSILLEDLGAQAGLGRSWALTEGSFGKVFGTSFAAGILIILLATLPQLAVSYGLGLLLANVDIVALVETVLAQVSLILTTPVSIGVTVVLYYDLRVRKEAFDLEWQVQQASTAQ
jgi:hypothetical protein